MTITTRAELTRKTLIRAALRRQRPGSGSSSDFLGRRTALAQWPDLRDVLGHTPCAVVGAVATRHYMPERATRDLDMVVAVTDATAARRALESAGWAYKGELAIGRSAWESLEGISLDLLEGQEEWWAAAIAEAQQNQDVQGLPIIPLPYLTLMKFRSSRAQDVADISRMLGQADAAELEATRKLFQEEEPHGLEDLQSLIYLGWLEMEER